MKNRDVERRVWIAVTKRGKPLCVGMTYDIALTEGFYYSGFYGVVAGWLTYDTADVKQEEFDE